MDRNNSLTTSVSVTRMMPEEYGKGGKGLVICYCYISSKFGDMLLAATHKGICYIAYADDKEVAINELKAIYPNATYQSGTNEHLSHAIPLFETGQQEPEPYKIHAYCTEFQLKVWQALVHVPFGKRISYRQLAEAIDMPQACRTVASAVAKNPVAYLIPCHRIIRSDGSTGEYHWGCKRKTDMLDWEHGLVPEE